MVKNQTKEYQHSYLTQTTQSHGTMKKKFSSLLIILALSFTIIQATHAEDVPKETPTSTPELIATPTSTPVDPVTSTPQTSTEESVNLPTIEATLRIETTDGALFEKTITVTACKPYEGAPEYTLNAKCLIEQAEGVTTTWNFFGTDAFLNSVNEYNNDFGTNVYWGYFINNEYGSTALNSYLLNTKDEILLVYCINPLKLEFSTSTPHVGDIVTISVLEFGLDENWNPVWIPSTSSTLTINGIPQILDSSTYNLLIDTTTPYLIQDSKVGYAHAEASLTGLKNDTMIEQPANTDSSGSGGGGNISNPTQSMITFLDAKQNTDGSFGTSAFLSDWAAIAYGAWDGSQSGKSKLSSYLRTDPSPLDGPNQTTNYARRAMGLMALGINPYTGTKTDYVQKILAGYDGNQFGDPGLFNDDIFALISLLKAGYTATDAVIVSTTKNIITNQSINGSFGSIDLTAAGIQALSLVDTMPSVADALQKAKEYLKNAQNTDGSFGNIYTTGWALQAFSAPGDNSSISGANYLTQNQAMDGGLLYGDTNSNRIWATSYAIPGILGKSWGLILTSFDKPGTTQNPGNTSSDSPTTTPTTPTTTSTIETTTSTISSTTTPIVTTVAPLKLEVRDTVSTKKPVTSIRRRNVLGIREENTESIKEDDGTITPEATKIESNTTTPPEATEQPQSNTKKYIFITSLIAFLLLTGYMGIQGMSSKK